ncbi:MarR family winged helix-turn-helix transcriptional regulator [Rhodoferax antarcticus]|uniref:MarR family winged helix-turn-helix transcriptional regulator n=1 Tax=Rhodoferax antarcticus TaxID=81479 RepID=UPI0022244200|nr:MarR family winged helix-turn-helix transcriptional regulator [Rhodoferax antarcticus]MCW2313573.1 DNA-binding MarR family transcriptional regulator [Rhodoferax antarcticus]
MTRRVQSTPVPVSLPDPASDPAEQAAVVLRRFRVVFNAVRTHFKQVEKQVGLGGAQVWALSIIRDQPSIGLGALARSMDVHQSTASNLVKGLLKKGLIRADKGQVDKRQVQLMPLPGALELLKQVPGPFEGVLPEALEQLPAETLQRLDHDLAELIALLKADEASGSIPLAQL